MGLKCHLPLTHRQCYQRVGARTWNRGGGCQLPDTSLGVSVRYQLAWAALEGTRREHTVLGDEGRGENRRRVTLRGRWGETQHNYFIFSSTGHLRCARFCSRLLVTAVNKADEAPACGAFDGGAAACIPAKRYHPLGGKNILFFIRRKPRCRYGK